MFRIYPANARKSLLDDPPWQKPGWCFSAWCTFTFYNIEKSRLSLFAYRVLDFELAPWRRVVPRPGFKINKKVQHPSRNNFKTNKTLFMLKAFPCLCWTISLLMLKGFFDDLKRFLFTLKCLLIWSVSSFAAPWLPPRTLGVFVNGRYIFSQSVCVPYSPSLTYQLWCVRKTMRVTLSHKPHRALCLYDTLCCWLKLFCLFWKHVLAYSKAFLLSAWSVSLLKHLFVDVEALPWCISKKICPIYS